MLLYDLLASVSRRFPDRIALYHNERTTTFSRLMTEIDRVSFRLSEKGVRPGDRVGLRDGEGDLWFVVFFAVLRLGATAVLFSPRLRGESLEALSRLTSPKLLLNREELPELFTDGRPASREFSFPKTDEHAPAVMLFTSGTSANPKAVMLSQSNLTESIVHILPRCLPPGCYSYLAALPMYHCFGLVSCLSYLCGGCCLYLPADLLPETLAELIFRHHIPILGSVGIVYSRLCVLPDFEEKIAPFVRLCVIGGGLSSPEFLAGLEKRFRNAVVYNGYGQTECSPYIAVPRYDDPFCKRTTTVGTPMDGTELRIISADGQILSPGNAGEILTRGYHVMLGYFSEMWAQPIDSEGFLHTGDVGYLDSDGYLHLQGRIKDIIIRNGENISPEEVERALLCLPGVKDATVVGLPHPVTGECVCACVVPQEGTSLSPELLTEGLKERLEHHKIPLRYCFASVLPRNQLGKVDRNAVAKLF